MPFQFKDFKATKPKARLSHPAKGTYHAFFIVYDRDNRKHQFRYAKGINNLKPRERKLEAESYAHVLWEALQAGWNPLIHKYPSFENEEKQLR